MSLSVADVFVFFISGDNNCRDSRERSSHDPREGARMLDFVYKSTYHRRFVDQYDAFNLKVPVPIHMRVVASFRHPFTGGIKPKKRVNA